MPRGGFPRKRENAKERLKRLVMRSAFALLSIRLQK